MEELLKIIYKNFKIYCFIQTSYAYLYNILQIYYNILLLGIYIFE